jgi:hypothetical protein
VDAHQRDLAPWIAKDKYNRCFNLRAVMSPSLEAEHLKDAPDGRQHSRRDLSNNSRVA